MKARAVYQGVNAGELFTRRCGGCGRMSVSARGLDDAGKRELARSFARRHVDCHEQTEAEPWRRCSKCGLVLLFEHRCPVHVYEERVPWTGELAEAYRAVVDSFAESGRLMPLPMGRPEYAEAFNLARLWGALRVEQDQEGVA